MTTPRYVSIQTLKDYVRSEVAVDDEFYEAAINAAETTLDNSCGRRFAVVSAGAASARSFHPTGSQWLFIHDCTEITGVTSGGATLTIDTEYSAEPLNGLSESGQSVPYNMLFRAGGWWPYSSYGATSLVAVTAKWGWTAIPPQIVEACKIIAKDIFQQRDIRFGLVAVSEAGGVGTRENRIVAEAVRAYGLRTGLVSI